MLVIDRRNRRNVQIFLFLCSLILISGLFFWFSRSTEWIEPDYLPAEVHENQKNEREAAIEKVRNLQKGLGEVAGEAVYDDGANKAMAQNRDRQGFESASALFQRTNSSVIREAFVVNGEKMTADSFYDEKLKQKQEEDRIAVEDPEDSTDDTVVDAVEVNRRNETASLDLVGKSAAVQTWLAKQEGGQKPLSAFESSLKVDEVQVQSNRRNPKFEQSDPELEKRKNRVHQFKFVQ